MLATIICAPVAPQILDDLHSDSSLYRTLLVSIWELGEVASPSISFPLEILTRHSEFLSVYPTVDPRSYLWSQSEWANDGHLGRWSFHYCSALRESEVYGRFYVYHIGNLLFLLFSVART
jgi:hypothetical protein